MGVPTENVNRLLDVLVEDDHSGAGAPSMSIFLGLVLGHVLSLYLRSSVCSRTVLVDSIGLFNLVEDHGLNLTGERTIPARSRHVALRIDAAKGAFALAAQWRYGRHVRVLHVLVGGRYHDGHFLFTQLDRPARVAVMVLRVRVHVTF